MKKCNHEFEETFAGHLCKKCGLIQPRQLTDWHPFGIDYSKKKNEMLFNK